jgi:hypothetical protein
MVYIYCVTELPGTELTDAYTLENILIDLTNPNANSIDEIITSSINKYPESFFSDFLGKELFPIISTIFDENYLRISLNGQVSESIINGMVEILNPSSSYVLTQGIPLINNLLNEIPSYGEDIEYFASNTPITKLTADILSLSLKYSSLIINPSTGEVYFQYNSLFFHILDHNLGVVIGNLEEHIRIKEEINTLSTQWFGIPTSLDEYTLLETNKLEENFEYHEFYKNTGEEFFRIEKIRYLNETPSAETEDISMSLSISESG